MHNSTPTYSFYWLLHVIERIQTRIGHLLVLTRVLIHHNAQDEKYVQYGAFVNAVMIFTDP